MISGWISWPKESAGIIKEPPAMHRTYEAVCENNRLEWLHERPDGRRYRVLVTVLEEYPSTEQRERSSEEVRRVLAETRGAWGSKSADEVDREMEGMREEWDRPWYPSNAGDE